MPRADARAQGRQDAQHRGGLGVKLDHIGDGCEHQAADGEEWADCVKPIADLGLIDVSKPPNTAEHDAQDRCPDEHANEPKGAPEMEKPVVGMGKDTLIWIMLIAPMLIVPGSDTDDWMLFDPCDRDLAHTNALAGV